MELDYTMASDTAQQLEKDGNQQGLGPCATEDWAVHAAVVMLSW